MKFTEKEIKRKELFAVKTLGKIAILAIRCLVGVIGEEVALPADSGGVGRRRRGLKGQGGRGD